MMIAAAMVAMTINFCWDGSCGTYSPDARFATMAECEATGRRLVRTAEGTDILIESTRCESTDVDA